MQDLLNQSEFTKGQNPWRFFYTFYAIAAVQLALFLLVIFFYNTTQHYKIILVALALATITAFTMLFSKKKIALLPLKTIALSLFIMMCIYYLPIAVVGMFTGASAIELLVCIALLAANFIFCFGIMYVINSKQRT